MLAKPPSDLISGGIMTDLDAHWAKYGCVLVSGYLEQSIKEIVLGYCQNKTSGHVHQYIAKSWPKSKNMTSENVVDIFSNFHDDWSQKVNTWLDQGDGFRRREVNSIVKLRNNIAHGNEANTTGVTMVTVKEKFRIACDLIDELESVISRG